MRFITQYLSQFKSNKFGLKFVFLLLGLSLFFICAFIEPFPHLNSDAQKVGGLAILMLFWWLSEAVSISVTALLPIIILPLMGVLDIKEVSSSYANPIIFLFMGGFIIALALQKWNLHRRIALTIVRIVGTSANGIILGFMLATAFLSMWISNTATTVMMLPIGLSVIDLLIKRTHIEAKQQKYFALSMMLAIAYSANIGGIATIVGTPPNVVFVGFIKENYDIEISFLNWMIVGLPFSIILLFIANFLITNIMYPNKIGHFPDAKIMIDEELKKLGMITYQEKMVLIVFVFTALLWIFRSSINYFLPSLNLSDAGISMIGAMLLFIIPALSSSNDKKQTQNFILEWRDAEKLPWGILLLFGGGLALANALKSVGIIDLIGSAVSSLPNHNAVWIILLLSAIVLFMTEVMSNVALIAVFLPVVAGIALGFDIPLLLAVIPITMASSCAFMLPMSTPPNAIVFASGYIRIPQMARAGIWLNIVGILVLTLFSQTFIPWIFS